MSSAKDMRKKLKKKNKRRPTELVKHSSEKGMDLVEPFAEMPVEQEVITGFILLLMAV